MWDLNKSLEKDIDNIIELGLSINNIYTKLCQMEKKGKKGTAKFKKYIDYLLIAVGIEENKLNKIIGNLDEMNLILFYLEEKYNLYGANSYLDYVYFDEETKAVLRIIETLESKIEEYENLENEEYLMNCDDYAETYVIINKTLHYHNLKAMNQYLKCSKDLKKLPISKCNEKTLSDIYIEYKYNMAFVDKGVEKSLIINNFEPKNLMVLSYEAQAEYLNMSSYYYELDIQYQLIINTLNEVFVYSDFSKPEQLLSYNIERKVLALWYLINSFNMMKSNDLIEIFNYLDEDDCFANVNNADKQTILALIENSFEKAIEREKERVKRKKKN